MQQKELHVGNYQRWVEDKMRVFNLCLIGIPEGKNRGNGEEFASFPISPQDDKYKFFHIQIHHSKTTKYQRSREKFINNNREKRDYL